MQERKRCTQAEGRERIAQDDGEDGGAAAASRSHPLPRLSPHPLNDMLRRPVPVVLGRAVRCLCTRLPPAPGPAPPDPKPQAGDQEKESFLPAERVWEGPKPESEIHKPQPEYWYTDPAFDPKVSDDPDEWPNIDPWTKMQYRYPHFVFPQRKDGGTAVDSWKDEWAEMQKSNRNIFNMSDTFSDPFPDQYDVIIIGGGVIGTSIALQIKERLRNLGGILVVEKDPTYKLAASTNSLGGITQQFMLPENLQMAHYGADFIRCHKVHLSMLDHPPPDPHFTSAGFLHLSDTTEQAEAILENQEKQTDFGSYVDVLNPHQMASRFPFLNTEDVLIGAYGVQDEGFVDPFAYLMALRGKAEFLGVTFMHAEFVDFNLEDQLPSDSYPDPEGDRQNRVRFVIVRLPDGRERQIRCMYPIIAAGHESANITKKLNIGLPDSRGMRMVPLPVEKRKRYTFVFNCPDGPGVNFPFLVDGTGVWCRREGLGGNFVCGKFVTDFEEPEPSNLDVDYGFFEHLIWPVLAKRVKAFERLKIVGAWAYYEDYNFFDQNPVIGKHPYYWNLVWACGFGRHALQMGPAVGRAFYEQLDSGWLSYKTIDLGRFGWSRIVNGKPLKERAIAPPPFSPLLPDEKKQASKLIK